MIPFLKWDKPRFIGLSKAKQLGKSRPGPNLGRLAPASMLFPLTTVLELVAHVKEIRANVTGPQ